MNERAAPAMRGSLLPESGQTVSELGERGGSMRPTTARRRSNPDLHSPGSVFGLLSCAALACGFEQSNAIDLPRTDGVPVELKNVRMAESLAVPLGPLRTTFSSSRANAIGIAFDVHVLDAAPHHTGVWARIACHVGEHTIVMPMATDASDRLATVAVGSTFEERTTFMPMPFSNGIPDVCETTLVYTIAPPLSHVPSPGDPPAARRHMQAIGTVCFSGGKLEARRILRARRRDDAGRLQLVSDEPARACAVG
jgi:hypothetical protein